MVTKSELQIFEELRGMLYEKARDYKAGGNPEHEVWESAAMSIEALVDEVSRLQKLHPEESKNTETLVSNVHQLRDPTCPTPQS